MVFGARMLQLVYVFNEEHVKYDENEDCFFKDILIFTKKTLYWPVALNSMVITIHADNKKQ